MTLSELFKAFLPLIFAVFMFICLVVLLPGCAQTTFSDGRASFSRTSFGTQTNISKLVVTRDGTATTVELEAESDQVQAIEKAVGAAVKAAKP